MTAHYLHLPLESNEHGEITDARGHNVLDAWFLASEDGPDAVLTEAEHEARAAARAAEVVRRVNLHDELIEALRIAFSHVDRDTHGNDHALVAAVLAKVEGR